MCAMWRYERDTRRRPLNRIIVFQSCNPGKQATLTYNAGVPAVEKLIKKVKKNPRFADQNGL